MPDGTIRFTLPDGRRVKHDYTGSPPSDDEIKAIATALMQDTPTKPSRMPVQGRKPAEAPVAPPAPKTGAQGALAGMMAGAAPQKAKPSPPDEAAVQGYIDRWLTSKSSGSAPFKTMVRYVNTPDAKREALLRGFSPEGRAAIREMAARYRESGKEATRQANEEARRIQRGIAYSGMQGFGGIGAAFFSPGSTEWDRLATMRATGQSANEALPLGFLPDLALTPREGFRGTLKAGVSDIARPSNLALMAGGGAAGGVPAVARALALAGVVPVGQAVARGDYGGALAEGLMNFTPDLAVASAPALARGMGRASAGLKRRAAAMDPQIASARAAAAPPAPAPDAIPDELLQLGRESDLAIAEAQKAQGVTPDAVQVQGPDAGVPRAGQPEVGLREVVKGNQVPEVAPRAGEGGEGTVPPSPRAEQAQGVGTLTQNRLEQEAATVGFDADWVEKYSGTQRAEIEAMRADPEATAAAQKQVFEYLGNPNARPTMVTHLMAGAAADMKDALLAKWNDLSAQRDAAAASGDAETVARLDTEIRQTTARIKPLLAMIHASGSAAGESLALRRWLKERFDITADNAPDRAVELALEMGLDNPEVMKKVRAIATKGRDAARKVRATQDRRAAGIVESPAGGKPAATDEARMAELKARIDKKLGRISANPIFDLELMGYLAQYGYLYLKQGIKNFPEWSKKIQDDFGNTVPGAVMQEAWLRAKELVKADVKPRPVPRPEVFADKLAARIPGGRPAAVAFMEKLREGGDTTLLDKILTGATLTADERAKVAAAWPAAPKRTPKPAAQGDPLTSIRQMVVEARKAAIAAKKTGKAAPKTAFEILTSRYGDKRGKAIHDAMTPEVRKSLEDGTAWTPEQEASVVAIFKANPATPRTPSTDPRFAMLRQAARKASAETRSADPQKVMDAYGKRLAALSETAEPPKPRTSPSLPEAVVAYRDGVKNLERFKASMRRKYESVSDERLNELFNEAAQQFEADNAQVERIKAEIAKTLGEEAFKSMSAARRLYRRLSNFQNVYRFAALAFDFGIGLQQLGTVSASRPMFGVASLPDQPVASRKRRIMNAVFGSTRGKSGGWQKAMYRAFGSDEGAARVQGTIDATESMRHPDAPGFYDAVGLKVEPYGTDLGGPISGEVIPEGSTNPLVNVPGVGRLAEKFTRGTNAGLNMARVVLFEQMWEPFTHLTGDQALEAGRVIAMIVNTLTGAGNYSDRVEGGIRFLSNLATAPRFYTSTTEFATGLMAPRVVKASMKQGRVVNPDGTEGYGYILPAKERAMLARAAGAEYARIGAAMLTYKMALAPFGIEVVLDPSDDDFGSARLPGPTKNTDVTIPLMGPSAPYHKLVWQSILGRRVRTNEYREGALPAPWAGEHEKVDWLRSYGGFAVNKALIGPQAAIAGAFPTQHPEYPKPDEPESFREAMEWRKYAYYTLPGGRKVSAVDPNDMALNVGGFVAPVPIIAKSFLQDWETVTGAGDGEGKKLLAATAAGRIAGFFGKGSRIQLKPEAKEEVPDTSYGLPPSEMYRIRTDVMKGK